MPAQSAAPTSPAHHHCTILAIGSMLNAVISALADMQRETQPDKHKHPSMLCCHLKCIL